MYAPQTPRDFHLNAFPAGFNREICYVYIAYLSNWRNMIQLFQKRLLL